MISISNELPDSFNRRTFRIASVVILFVWTGKNDSSVEPVMTRSAFVKLSFYPAVVQSAHENEILTFDTLCFFSYLLICLG